MSEYITVLFSARGSLRTNEPKLTTTWCKDGAQSLNIYNTSLLIWQPSAGLKEKQSHTNKDTHSELHYWKLVKENGIKEFWKRVARVRTDGYGFIITICSISFNSIVSFLNSSSNSAATLLYFLLRTMHENDKPRIRMIVPMYIQYSCWKYGIKTSVQQHQPCFASATTSWMHTRQWHSGNFTEYK